MRIKLIFSFIIVVSTAAAQLPARKVAIGLHGKENANGIAIDSIVSGSTFSQTKIQPGDIIASVNNQSVTSMKALYSAFANTREGDKISVTFLHGGKEKTQTIKGIAKPFQQSAIANIKYDWVKFKSGYLRAITYLPKGKTNVPAILLIPGYGCGSIENYVSSYNGKLIHEWLKNGYAVVTIEKSGMGDSYGCAPCGQADLVTDIQSFDEGYKYMEALPEVDKNRLFIWGHSMGGTIAPEVAKKHSPRGVMVFACVFRPWSEFLLEMYRVQKPLMDSFSYQQTEDFVRQIQKVLYEFFILKKSPAELDANPEYKTMVEGELGYKENSNDMWGRH